MQYRQKVTRMPITRVDQKLSRSIVKIRSIWRNSAADFLRFEKFPLQLCEAQIKGILESLLTV